MDCLLLQTISFKQTSFILIFPKQMISNSYDVMLPRPLKPTLLSKCAIFYSDLFIIDNRLDITKYLVGISLNCLNITVLLFFKFFFVNKVAFLTLCSYSITYR